MKKYISIVLCFAISALMSGCDENRAYDSDSDKETVKITEEVTDMKTSESTYDNFSGKQIPDDIDIPSDAVYCRADNYSEYVFYDKYDNIIQVNNADYLETHEYTYNEDGTIAADIYNDNMTSETYLYTYNPDKTLYKYQTKGKDDYTLYEYDKYGHVVCERIMRESDGICMLVTEYENIYENGRLIVQIDKSDSVLGTETTYEYDEKGNITREIVKSTALDETVTDSQRTYYDDGKLKSENRNYVYDGIPVFYEYNYIYF